MNKKTCSQFAFDLAEFLAKKLFGDKFEKLRQATDAEDTQEATDLVIELRDGMCIPVAVRELKRIEYRDCTIRLVNEGAKTEWAKIKEGGGKWYLYTWKAQGENTPDYALLNLDRMRKYGLFDGSGVNSPWKLLPHDLRTQATKIDFFHLHEICPQCVIACAVTEYRPPEIAELLPKEFAPVQSVKVVPSIEDLEKHL